MWIALKWDTRRGITSIYRTRLNRMVNGVPASAEVCGSIIPSIKGAFTVGKITEEQRFDIVRHACPGAGACGGMYTYVHTVSTCRAEGTDVVDSANTMSSALEALGLSLPYSSSIPATYPGALFKLNLNFVHLTADPREAQGV